jgi:imidazolonepropionase-like amidohydrolase
MRTVIRGGKLIDGTNHPPTEGGMVIVEGAKIKEVIKNRSNPPPILSEDKLIDATGKVVLPGLINAHLHLYLDGGNNPLENLGYEKGALSLLKAVTRCKEIISNGITTVRDMGAKDYGIISLKNATDEEVIMGPRIHTCGKAIAIKGGHAPVIARTIDSPDEIGIAVREQIEEGCDFIKVFSTGGFGEIGEDPNSYELTLDEIKSAVQDAHAAGKRLAAHAYGNQGIRHAIEAGVDSIEHGTFLDEETISKIIRKGIFLTPTLSNPYQIITNGKTMGVARYLVEVANRIFPLMVEQFRNAYNAGVKIVAGTDGGSWLNPHHDIVTELKLRGETGVVNLELIRMATKTAAECLGLNDEIGTIEIGKVADIIIVEGDPLTDIESLKNICLVMKRGKVLKEKLN